MVRLKKSKIDQVSKVTANVKELPSFIRHTGTEADSK
jgi:hypothetical protein